MQTEKAGRLALNPVRSSFIQHMKKLKEKIRKARLYFEPCKKQTIHESVL